MIKDWQAFVNPGMICSREIPCHAPLVKHILETEISALLQPASLQPASPASTHYPNGLPLSPTPGGVEEPTTKSVLDKWTDFLSNLPERFGSHSPRYFNMCLGAVASAALRDLTTNGAISFGSWWVVRCWIDEWMSWQAERGGFLLHGLEDAKDGSDFLVDRKPSTNEMLDVAGEMNHHDDVNVPMRDEQLNRLLEDVGDDRDNRMVPINFGK